MSVTGLTPATDKPFKKPSRHRHGSDELDVFEASRYFAGEPTGSIPQKIMIKDQKQSIGGDYWNRVSTGGGGGGMRRISLDIPSMRNNHHHQSLFSSFQHHQSHHLTAADRKEIEIPKDKKHKQPSSPGGRIASFLNSLFTQSSKKKKPKSATSTHDAGDSPGGGRRKRRSSISHFPTNPNQNATVYSVSSKNSGFRTPPAAYAQTPIKIPHRSFSDHNQTVTLCREKKNPDPYTQYQERSSDFRFRDEEKTGGLPEIDDGAESDSSSDLFELQNYDLGDYSSGLPVYETTRMDNIKRGAPISVHGP